MSPDGFIVDLFAGGGGASTGIERALGRSPDIAIDHDAQALAMHAANHPATRHIRKDVWDVDPFKVCAGRAVALLWASPDCTYFSKARGAKPFHDRRRASRRRTLAHVVVRWARTVRPNVIALENVEEFEEWGPLGADGLPDPTRVGLSFRRWRRQLENLGYRVELRQLRACDFGAPTIRRRLFVVARCDGQPIVWPEPTHGPGRAHPFRTAAKCIDWTLPVPSIFDRKRPLAENTLHRIAQGIRKFVIDARESFIVFLTHHDVMRGQGISEPLRTVTGVGEMALVAAFLAKHFGGVVGTDLRQPTGTVTTVDHHAVATVQLGSPADRSEQVHAFLLKYYGTGEAQNPQLPLGTVTTKDRFGLVYVKGEPYRIVDIGMRMLSPRELFHAQGFGEGYVIDPIVDGKPLTKTAQVRLCGNSVCPDVAAAIVRANCCAAARVRGAA